MKLRSFRSPVSKVGPVTSINGFERFEPLRHGEP